ncbi:MAG: hypothetical protein ACI9NQ_001937 [Paracoccaceae bacterium]|jgi:hypothetical protein
MKKLTRLLVLPLLTFGTVFADDDLWESKGPLVRIKKNDRDGSFVVFERSKDDRSLVKTTKDHNKKIKMMAKYERNQKGFLSVGRIYDGQGTLLYRVKYGYHPETAQLIAEDMFDARVKNYYPASLRDEHGNRVEMPVRRVYYFYDADGNQSKAISLVPNPGKTAEETFDRTRKELDLYGVDPKFHTDSATNPNDNPFEAERKKKEKSQ